MAHAPNSTRAHALLSATIVQLVIFGLIYLMPAALATSGHLSITSLFAMLDSAGRPLGGTTETALLALFWALYAGSFLLLTSQARWNFPKPPDGTKIHGPIWWCALFRACRALLPRCSARVRYRAMCRTRVVINAGVVILNAVTLGTTVIMALAWPGQTYLTDEAADDVLFVAAGAVMFVITPMLLSLMHSWASFVTLISSFGAYFVMLPTILVDFVAYSIARLDDLSWGTKAAAVEVCADAADATFNRQARIARDTRVRVAGTTTTLHVTQLLLFCFLSLGNVVLANHVRLYLIVQGVITTSLTMSIMWVSMSYYCSRASTRLFTCRSSCTDLSCIDDIFRILVAAMWMLVLLLWAVAAVQRVTGVEVLPTVAVGLSNPLAMLALLLGATGAFAVVRLMVRSARRPAALRDAEDAALDWTRQRGCRRACSLLLACACGLSSITCMVAGLAVCNSLWSCCGCLFAGCCVRQRPRRQPAPAPTASAPPRRYHLSANEEPPEASVPLFTGVHVLDDSMRTHVNPASSGSHHHTM